MAGTVAAVAIDDLDIVGVAVVPAKAEVPWVVFADRYGVSVGFSLRVSPHPQPSPQRVEGIWFAVPYLRVRVIFAGKH